MSNNLGNTVANNLGTNVANNLGRNVANNVANNLGRNVAKNVARNVTNNLARNVANNVANNLGKNVAKNAANNLGRNVANNLGKNVAKNAGKNVANNVGKKISKTSNKVLNTIKNNKNKILITLGIVILIIVLSVGGYYLYKHLTYYKASEEKTKVFIPYIHDAKVGKTIQSSSIPKSSQGNEYNYSIWIYISDYTYRNDEDKCILYRGPDPSSEKLDNSEDIKYNSIPNTIIENSNPSVWLLKNNNTLRVRVGLETMYEDEKCEDTKVEHFQSKYNLDKHYEFLKNVTDDLDDLHKAYDEMKEINNNSKSHSDKSANVTIKAGICEIENMPLQRWNHLNISLHDNLIDICINGKLSKSCVLPGAPIMTQTDNLYVCKDEGFNGYIANLSVSNKALPIEKVYSIYKKGPTLKKGLF